LKELEQVAEPRQLKAVEWETEDQAEAVLRDLDQMEDTKEVKAVAGEPEDQAGTAQTELESDQEGGAEAVAADPEAEDNQD
jgi:hypothetical protein